VSKVYTMAVVLPGDVAPSDVYVLPGDTLTVLNGVETLYEGAFTTGARVEFAEMAVREEP
jgi:hypothetical protein